MTIAVGIGEFQVHTENKDDGSPFLVAVVTMVWGVTLAFGMDLLERHLCRLLPRDEAIN
jgi:hypothetical protein